LVFGYALLLTKNVPRIFFVFPQSSIFEAASIAQLIQVELYSLYDFFVAKF